MTPAKKRRHKRYDALINLLERTREQDVDAGICEAIVAAIPTTYGSEDWNVAMDIAGKISNSLRPYLYFTDWYEAQTGESMSIAQARPLRRQWVEELITQAKRERDAL